MLKPVQESIPAERGGQKHTFSHYCAAASVGAIIWFPSEASDGCLVIEELGASSTGELELDSEINRKAF
jgi:hypothetical protein